MEDDYAKYSGIKWLFELELIQDPQVINAIKMNILMISKHIKEIEILTVEQNKQMLILLELSWFGRTFYKKRLCNEALSVVKQLLPNFRIRVIDDRNLFQKSIDKLRKVVANVKTNSDSDDASKQ